jgi:uncharacterized DUF497 family protein
VALEFDPRKDAANVEKHGISLARFADMDQDAALVLPAKRVEDEERYRFVGTIDGKVWVAVVTWRGEDIRVISLRRADSRERRAYVSKP